MPVGGQTGAFPPIGSVYWRCIVTHSQTHALMHSSPHKGTEIGLLIALRQTDLKGKQRSLIEGPLR